MIRSIHSTGDGSMKRFALALLMLPATLLLAASDKPNPSDFPVTVHVVFASTSIGGGQRIDVLIDGQPMELASNATGVLTLGDYPARVSPKVVAPKNWSPYDNVKGYDFLMPDGKVRTFTLTAMGTSLFPGAARNP